MEKKIHVKDLAPFASIEDLSDERESPLDEEKQKSKLSNIEEEMKTPTKTNLNVMNTTPRIDISRASSSSHQEDSSPERELVLGKFKDSKLEVAFGEEIASDLHSSTEELSFHDTEDVERLRRKKPSQILSDVHIEIARKDSGCSNDFALLSISGRTSRVSSVGSVASGGSGLSNISIASRCSAASHLSAVSNVSRGSSPHRMSLETSFCGPKPVHSTSIEVENTVTSVISDKLRQKTETANTNANANGDGTTVKRKAVVARQQPKSATAASARETKTSRKDNGKHHKRRKPPIENPKTQKFVSLYSDEEEESIASRCANAKQPAIPKSAAAPVLDSSKQIFIPLKGDDDDAPGLKAAKSCQPNPNSPRRMKPFTNTTLVNFISKYDVDGNLRKRRMTAGDATASKGRYEDNYEPKQNIYEEFQTFISMKDDDDDTDNKERRRDIKMARPVNRSKENSNVDSNRITVPIQVHHENSSSSGECGDRLKHSTPIYVTSLDGNSQYIPLRGSDSLLQTRNEYDLTNGDNYLSVAKLEPKSRSDDHSLSYLSTTIYSTDLDRHQDGHGDRSSMELLSYCERPSRSARSMTQLISTGPDFYSRTPSPNASVTNNNYPFRRCSESAKEIRNIDKSKSRSSGSIRSMFSSIFKRNGSAKSKKSTDNSKHEAKEETRKPVSSTEQSAVVQKASRPEQADTIIIPLHSPSENQPPSDRPHAKENPEKTNNVEDLPLNNSKITDEKKKKTATSHSPVNTKSSTNIERNVPNTQELSRSDELEWKKSSHEKRKITRSEKAVEINENQSQSCEKCNFSGDVASSVDNRSAPNSKAEKNDGRPTVDNDGELSSSEAEVLQTTVLERTATLSAAENKKPPAQETNEEDYEISTDSDKVNVVINENNDENKKLVNQQDESFEELPYIPTTLPLERSVAVPIVPIRERSNEIRTTTPVDRPRSLKPINTTTLDFYASAIPSNSTTTEENTTEKLHITLPRTGSIINSPRKKNSLTRRSSEHSSIRNSHHVHCEISEELTTDGVCTSKDKPESPPPPPLPPRKSSTSWISFEESKFEMNRQSPKRITTLPSSYSVIDSNVEHEKIKINQNIIFVNPNECSCECHETQHVNVKTTYYENKK